WSVSVLTTRPLVVGPIPVGPVGIGTEGAGLSAPWPHPREQVRTAAAACSWRYLDPGTRMWILEHRCGADLLLSGCCGVLVQTSAASLSEDARTIVDPSTAGREAVLQIEGLGESAFAPSGYGETAFA